MPKKMTKQVGKTAAVKDFVTVAFAEDMELAKQYKDMLGEHEIPVAIKRQPEMAQNGFSDIAILVPESLLDEAHTLISEESSYDDFFDMIFGDDDCREADNGNDFNEYDTDNY